MEERKSQPSSFRRDTVKKIFQDAFKKGLKLEDSKRPDNMKHSDDPNYCPYHRLLGHPIEDCWVFKDWVEKKEKEGSRTLSKSVLSARSCPTRAS